MGVSNTETLDKVVDFLDMSNHENFSISPMLYRSFTGCQITACGGCCKRLSLNYLEGSERWERFKSNYPDKVQDFKKREFQGATFFTNEQSESDDYYCTYLDKSNGFCTIHKDHSHPLSCDLPFVKFSPRTHATDEKKNKTLLTSMPYGRPHTFKRVDGGVGAMCYSTPFEVQQTEDNIMKLRELSEHGVKMGKDVRKLNEAINEAQRVLNKYKQEGQSAIPKEAVMIKLPVIQPNQLELFK